MSNDLVTLMTFSELPEASFYQSLLEENGFLARLDNENTASVFPVGGALGAVHLQVPADQAEAATAFLRKATTESAGDDAPEDTFFVGEGVDIRDMAIDDYEAARALWERVDGVAVSESDSREGLAAYLRRNPGMSLVAVADGALVGAVLCGHDGRRGYIHHLAVDEPWRRQGLAVLMVEECLANLREEGIAKCHIVVMADNADGVAFWQNAGWERRDNVVLMSRSTTD